jgi:thioesterase domain-containing protein
VARRSVEWTACEIVADLGAGHRSGVPGGLGVDEALTVVGYSVGGTTAHEVACRLAAGGQQVALLALLDFAPRPAGALARERRRRLDRATASLRAGDVHAAIGHIEVLVTDPLAPYLLALAERVPAVGSRRARLSMAHGRRAAARHEAAEWPGRTLLAWSAARPDGRARWGARLSGHVDEVTIGGDHVSLLAPPQVDDLGRALLAAMASSGWQPPEG